MQELNDDMFGGQFARNNGNSHDIVKSTSRTRFIECIRCGKQIKNDPRVIKNHEYYCRNKELASTNKVGELSSENEYTGNKYMEDLQMQEKATFEPVSDKITDDSGSYSDIVLIGVAIGIIGAILIVYKILAQKKHPDSNITQTPMDNGELTIQSPEIVRPWAYLFPIN